MLVSTGVIKQERVSPTPSSSAPVAKPPPTLENLSREEEAKIAENLKAAVATPWKQKTHPSTKSTASSSE